MQGLQEWFSPLLWVIATITALAAFIRLCRPVWSIFSSPKDFLQKISALESKIDKFNSRVDDLHEEIRTQQRCIDNLLQQNTKKDDIILSLLHDSIVQIYQEAKDKGEISEVGYYRACELYKQDGNSTYIDNIMKALTEIHNKGIMPNDQAQPQPQADEIQAMQAMPAMFAGAEE